MTTKEKVIELLNQGITSPKEIANRINAPIPTVSKIKTDWKRTDQKAVTQKTIIPKTIEELADEIFGKEDNSALNEQENAPQEEKIDTGIQLHQEKEKPITTPNKCKKPKLTHTVVVEGNYGIYEAINGVATLDFEQESLVVSKQQLRELIEELKVLEGEL